MKIFMLIFSATALTLGACSGPVESKTATDLKPQSDITTVRKADTQNQVDVTTNDYSQMSIDEIHAELERVKPKIAELRGKGPDNLSDDELILLFNYQHKRGALMKQLIVLRRVRADEAQRRADEAQRRADEAQRRADEAQRRGDEAQRRGDEACRIAAALGNPCD